MVMPFLSFALRRAGRELGSGQCNRRLRADPAVHLSGILLVGLPLNSLSGWSWADPLVALVIAGVAAKEGHDEWRGKRCS